jgi:hypothetical protein
MHNGQLCELLVNCGKVSFYAYDKFRIFMLFSCLELLLVSFSFVCSVFWITFSALP